MSAARRRLPNRRPHELIDFERDGIRCTAGFGRFEDGHVAEFFLNAGKPGSAVDIAARDAAVAVSLALQHGCDLATIRHALTRLADNSAAGPIGRALDLIEAVAA